MDVNCSHDRELKNTPVIPAEAGIQQAANRFWMPDRVRHDDNIFRNSERIYDN